MPDEEIEILLSRISSDDITLEEISLAGKRFSYDEIRGFLDCIANNKIIKQLNLDGHLLMTESFIEKIVTYVKNNGTLTTLSLAGHSPDSEKLWGPIIEVTKTHPSLTSLDFSTNEMGDVGAKAFADLCQNKNLNTLDLSNNSIGIEGARLFAEVLLSNKTLKTLILNHNEFGNKGAEKIIESLRTNRTLTKLGLGRSEINATSIKNILNTLQCNITLTSLDVSQNPIGPDGACFIADFLKNNLTLTALDLFDCYLTSTDFSSNPTSIFVQDKYKGIKAIAEALKHNKTLTMLRLSGNDLDDKSATYILDALKYNYRLIFLGLTISKEIQEETLSNINALLERNRNMKRLEENMLAKFPEINLAESASSALEELNQLKQARAQGHKIDHNSASVMMQALSFCEGLVELQSSKIYNVRESRSFEEINESDIKIAKKASALFASVKTGNTYYEFAQEALLNLYINLRATGFYNKAARELACEVHKLISTEKNAAYLTEPPLVVQFNNEIKAVSQQSKPVPSIPLDGSIFRSSIK